MKPGEVISVQHDNNRRGLPRENVARKSGGRISQASVWTTQPAVDFEASQFWGAYPKDFIKWACRAMRCNRHDVVHLCSGTLPAGEGALRVDIRAETKPDLVADCRALPLPDGFAGAVMIDPPYSVEYAKDLYTTDYPRPSALLAEACRIAQPGAPIGFLHFLVALPPAGASIETVYGVTTGPNYRIRAFTVFRKDQAGLFRGPETETGDTNGNL